MDLKTDEGLVIKVKRFAPVPFFLFTLVLPAAYTSSPLFTCFVTAPLLPSSIELPESFYGVFADCLTTASGDILCDTVHHCGLLSISSDSLCSKKRHRICAENAWYPIRRTYKEYLWSTTERFFRFVHVIDTKSSHGGRMNLISPRHDAGDTFVLAP